MAEHVMLVVAQEGDESSPLVAGALNLVTPPPPPPLDFYISPHPISLHSAQSKWHQAVALQQACIP